MASKSRVSTRRKQTTAGTFEEHSVLKVKFIPDSDVKRLIFSKNGTTDSKKENKNVTKSTLKTKSVKTKETPKRKVEKDEVGCKEDSDNDCDINDALEKPTGLCDEDDVAGDRIYAFRTPKKSQGMLQKARDSASKHKSDSGTPTKTKRRVQSISNSPATPSHKRTPHRKSLAVRETPKKTQATPRKDITVDIPKTPYQLRVRQKAAIQAHKRKLEESEGNSDDSDYHGSSSQSDDSGSEEDDSSSDSGKGSEPAVPSCRRSIRFQPPSTPSTRKRGKDVNYVFTADEYFHSRASKCVTSDHRLSRLQTPRLDTSALNTLLTKCSVSADHQHVLTQRRARDTDMFTRWMFALSQGFSVLAYGLGSKYSILQRFQREMLSDSYVLVVNGFFPSLTIKEIVEMMARDILGLTQVLPSPLAVVDWIQSRRWMPRVFLLVHNLDAQMLRGDKTQHLLSRLASLPKVHLVASVDHINCPLLWDQAKLSGFNFMWEDTTSFLPYQEETSYETSLMVHNSGALALTSLLSVYRSLTHNAQGVFRIILDRHLQENSKNYTGMAFSELYGRCREEMLVTSDLALRTMLTEFLDHQMVKWRRDGEHLHIPTESGVLRQFQQHIQDS